MLGKKNKKNEADTQPRSAEEFSKKLPDLAKKYELRISKPYGYFHEDVENTIIKLEAEINNLTKENIALTKEKERVDKELKDIKTEFSRFRTQVAFSAFDETTEAQDIAKISGINDINSENTKTKNQIKLKPANSTITPTSSSSKTKSKTFDNLIRPKNNNGG